MLSSDQVAWVLSKTGASALRGDRLLQSLWGGYGDLRRLTLDGGPVTSVILKCVVPPARNRENASDRRKHRSYEVEQNWYRQGATGCTPDCRVAHCFGTERRGEALLLLLEDLGGAGFHPCRPPRPEHLNAGLRWLAHFHARFLGATPPGLWEQGTYWHLETRQDELLRMPPGPLKDNAPALDRLLRQARYQTLVHGDAKPANFCWSDDGGAAAVDFQYVGAGCGIRDVAYLLDCCLSEEKLEARAASDLDFYFSILRKALPPEAPGEDVEAEWRALFPVAWSDFWRFYQGWGNPPPLGPYSQRQVRAALSLIQE